MGRREVVEGSEHTQTAYGACKMAGPFDGQAYYGPSAYMRCGDFYLSNFMLRAKLEGTDSTSA